MAIKADVVTLKQQKDVTRLIFKRSDIPVNILDEACMQALETCLDALELEPPKVLVLESAMTGCFIAGADIHAIAAVKTLEDAEVLVLRGQQLCRRVEQLSSVSVAVVHGTCLGGGMELALACDAIVAVDDAKTQLGLPEVKLGIHPGFGGCVRLPKRVGWPAAVQMILSGRSVNAKRALRMGLADLACYPEQVNAAVARLSAKGKSKRVMKPRWFALWPARKVFFMLAERKLRERFQALDLDTAYPALPATLRLLESIAGVSDDAAYQREATSIGQLASTSESCKNLIRVFFLGEGLKHQNAVKKGKAAASEIDHAAVYGAGAMGSGIAWVASKSGSVDMHDIAPEALSRGLQAAAKFAKYDAQRLQRIRPSLGSSGLASADVVIEAVLEVIAVKQALWQDIEASVSKDTLLLSNTSSLSVTAQQEGLKYPARMAGLHFFNPAPKMPLVEVIAGEKTSQKTLQTVAALAASWGKYPVVVADRPGFLVNRCLMPFMIAALRLLQKGQSVQHVDSVLKEFGMPMGAIELADRVGLDICLHVGEHLSGALGDGSSKGGQFSLPEWFAGMVSDGLLGEKSGAGFYVYSKGQCQQVNAGLNAYVKMPVVKEKEFDADASVHDVHASLMTADVVIDACMIPMLLEALSCLQEGVVEAAEHLDAALVYGIGFPPFRGGLLRYYAGRNRVELRQLIADMGFELPDNLEVLDEFI